MRAMLDSLFGFPSSNAITCIEPSETAPNDFQGNVVVALNETFCENSSAIQLIETLIASGDVWEITEQMYRESVSVDV